MTDTVIGTLFLGGLTIGLALLTVWIARPFANSLPRSPIVQYVPPTGDIVQHGLALRADRRVYAAAVIDMAVKGKVRVLAPRKARGPVAIEARVGSGLTAEDRNLLQSLRPRLTGSRKRRRYVRAMAEVGIHAETPEEGPDLYFLKGRGAFRRQQRRAISAYLESARRQLHEAGISRKRAVRIHLYLLSLLFLTVCVVGALLALGAFMNGEWVPGILAIATIVGVFGVLTIAPPPILRFTGQGHGLRQYLSGMRDYVRLGERERLQMLQSPRGALRTPAGALTPGGQALGLRSQPSEGDLVAQSNLDRYLLIERLLPYAVLFRCERGWQQEFEHLSDAGITSQNIRVLGSTLEGVMAVLEALMIIGQLLRLVGTIFSFLGRASS